MRIVLIYIDVHTWRGYDSLRRCLLDGGPEDVSTLMYGVFACVVATSLEQSTRRVRAVATRLRISMQPVQLAPHESRAESRHDSRPDATLRAAIKRRGAPLRRAVLGTSLALFALASSATFSSAFAAGEPANPDATPSDTPEADLNIQAQPAGQWTG